MLGWWEVGGWESSYREAGNGIVRRLRRRFVHGEDAVVVVAAVIKDGEVAFLGRGGVADSGKARMLHSGVLQGRSSFRVVVGTCVFSDSSESRVDA